MGYFDVEFGRSDVEMALPELFKFPTLFAFW